MKKFIIAIIIALCTMTPAFALVAPPTTDPGIDTVCVIAALSFVAFLALGYYKFKDR